MLSFKFDLGDVRDLFGRKWILRGRQHSVRPFLEGENFFRVKANLFGNDDAGKGQGKFADELAFAFVDEFVDQFINEFLDARCDRGHGRAREYFVEQLAISGMLGRIGALKRLNMFPATFLQHFLLHVATFALKRTKDPDVV